jgi:lipopolysaccharide transport system ATP-binding protein
VKRVVFRLPFTCTLGPGSYSVSPALVSSETHLINNYEWIDNLMVFDVINVERKFFIGTIGLMLGFPSLAKVMKVPNEFRFLRSEF